MCLPTRVASCFPARPELCPCRWHRFVASSHAASLRNLRNGCVSATLTCPHARARTTFRARRTRHDSDSEDDKPSNKGVNERYPPPPPPDSRRSIAPLAGTPRSSSSSSSRRRRRRRWQRRRGGAGGGGGGDVAIETGDVAGHLMLPTATTDWLGGIALLPEL